MFIIRHLAINKITAHLVTRILTVWERTNPCSDPAVGFILTNFTECRIGPTWWKYLRLIEYKKAHLKPFGSFARLSAYAIWGNPWHTLPLFKEEKHLDSGRRQPLKDKPVFPCAEILWQPRRFAVDASLNSKLTDSAENVNLPKPRRFVVILIS